MKKIYNKLLSKICFFVIFDGVYTNFILGNFSETDILVKMVKFIYSEKATEFCEISTVYLSYVKFTVEILEMEILFSSQNL